MRKIVVMLLMISTAALASEGGTDIVQRTVNFLLFAGLIWYLVGEPVKNFFASRTQGIADELNKAQEKLAESVAKKKDALAKVAEAENFAEEIIATAKKESKILNDNILEQCEVELDNLEKQFASKREFEQRNMVREVVEEVVGATLEQSSDVFDREAMANVILKKVA
jgi:F-type H+-transporting ATPase subunit b